MIILGMLGPWQILLLLMLIIPIIALIDILRSNFKGDNKLIWVLVVLFFNIIGSLLYFIIGIRQKMKK